MQRSNIGLLETLRQAKHLQTIWLTRKVYAGTAPAAGEPFLIDPPSRKLLQSYIAKETGDNGHCVICKVWGSAPRAKRMVFFDASFRQASFGLAFDEGLLMRSFSVRMVP